MHIRILFLTVLSSTYALAAAAPLAESDFVYRVINATIFFSILYYLLNDTVRNFFKGRTEEIANRLEEVSKRLQASKQARKDAQLELEKAKAKAIEIVENAKKECQLVANKIEQQSEIDVQNLDKSYLEKLKLERSKVTKEIVEEILEELLGDDVASIDQEKFIKLVSKKVA